MMKPAARLHGDQRNPNLQPRSAGAPVMVARFLLSCGYRVDGQLERDRGWLRGAVVDRTSGAPRGVRWVRRLANGYEVRSEAPC